MDETFAVFHRVFSFAGVTIFSKKKWDSNIWLCFQTFNFIIGVFTFVFTTGFVVTSFSDLVAWIEGVAIWATGVIMFISLGVCLMFRNSFRNFLEEMVFKDGMLDMPFIRYVLETERSGKLNELKVMVLQSQEKLMKYTRVLLKGYVAIVWFVATMYLCDPIYKMTVREDKSQRFLAFEMWFPWSLENIYVYIATFVFHAHAGYLCCIAYPGLQCTIILMLGQIIRQLRILGFVLLHLDSLVIELVRERDERWQKYCTVVLSQSVDHYVKIKRFSNSLNFICRPFYLTLILVAILLVCVCSVKIAISNKLSPDTMKYYVHGFCFIVIVLLFCLLGEQVQTECEILDEVVTTKWYTYNRGHKKNVSIFKRALGEAMPIYIFGSITLSLPTFTWFIRTEMSFFTVVMSVFD